MSLFEVHHLDILEHLQTYFEQLIRSFERLNGIEENQDFFGESFTKSLLKASLSVCTFFSKYLSAKQYEAVIKNVLVITGKSFSDDVDSILDVITKESTKNVGFKLVFQAMLNSYDEVILDKVAQAANVSPIIIRYFNSLFKPVIQRIKKEFVVENHLKIYDFFKSAFALTYTFNKNNGGVDMPQVREVDQAIASSYE